jgi:hypothetical protein
MWVPAYTRAAFFSQKRLPASATRTTDRAPSLTSAWGAIHMPPPKYWPLAMATRLIVSVNGSAPSTLIFTFGGVKPMNARSVPEMKLALGPERLARFVDHVVDGAAEAKGRNVQKAPTDHRTIGRGQLDLANVDDLRLVGHQARDRRVEIGRPTRRCGGSRRRCR